MADEVARERYDPNDLNPQLEQASNMAQEGIADDAMRQQVIQSIFSQGGMTTPSVAQGMNSGRAVSFMEKLNQQRVGQLGSAETKIGLAEEEAMRQGEIREAEIQTKRKRLQGEREARIEQNRLRAEAEIDNRKKQLGATVGKLAGTLAGGALGPLGAAGAGALAGGLTGGSSGFVAGGVSGAGSAIRRENVENFLARGEEGAEGETEQGFNLFDFLKERLGGEDGTGDLRTQEDLEFIGRILGGQGFPSEMNLAQ